MRVYVHVCVRVGVCVFHVSVFVSVCMYVDMSLCVSMFLRHMTLHAVDKKALRKYVMAPAKICWTLDHIRPKIL